MDPNDSTRIQPAPRRDFVELSRHIIGSFYDVYNELGPGLLEVLYSRALEISLRDKGLVVEREHPVVVLFRGHNMGFQRVDMLVQR